MKYTMNTKELARLTVIKGAIDGVYTVKQAARKPGVSAWRVKALKKAVREQGDGAVIHGNAGRHPVNATGEKIREKITALKTGPVRNNRRGKLWIKPNSAISPKSWAVIVFPPEAPRPKGALNGSGRPSRAACPSGSR
jgi:hypothetical protein